MATFRICQYAALAGIAAHWGYFIRGEHHTEAPLLALLYFAVPPIIFAVEWVLGGDGFAAPALRTAAISLSFLVPLWASMIVYRVYFHRLRNFPGPVMNKVTKLWHMGVVAPKSDNYRYLDRLYHEYGDFVRTGPTELTIFHPDGVQALLAPGSKCTKTPWYDIALPLTSLHTERSKAVHDRRRKVWDKGFSAKALRGYEDRVVGFSETLVGRLKKSSGQVVNATTEFGWFAFDIMGDVAFGKSFEMMESGKTHFAVKIIKDGMAPLGALSPVPWLMHTLTKIPGAATAFHELIRWCSEQVENRRKTQGDADSATDVMTYLIEAYENSAKTDADHQLLNGDSRLIIVAGSDTTSATLTSIFYCLAKYPDQIEKLRTELDPLMQNSDQLHNSLKDATHLNAVVNEALRLFPPVPGGIYRQTPPEGIKIGNTFVPGNVICVPPSYTVQRLASCFVQPDDFIPERWTTKPELTKSKSTYAPFSLGPYSCVGKMLALMELRTVVAKIVTTFDVSFAPGEDGSALINELKDYFTVEQHDLKLIFSARK